MDPIILLMFGAIFLSIAVATGTIFWFFSDPQFAQRRLSQMAPAQGSLSAERDLARRHQRQPAGEEVPLVRAQVAEGHGPDRAHARGRRLLRRVAGHACTRSPRS